MKRAPGPPPTPGETLQNCRRCDLWKHATQAVDGEGPPGARIMLVGEQPGDEEDLRGHPFVGPAGAMLNDAIEAAGLERSALYITNAVKHFKWEPRGKRRLHKKPGVGEIKACSVWLEREIDEVKPRVIVALGGTALRALTGAAASIDSARREELRHARRREAHRELPSLGHRARRGGEGYGAANHFGERFAARSRARRSRAMNPPGREREGGTCYSAMIPS